ncbi:hypothetical protein [Lysinibacillus telephonicus]|uniref:hypothetical protein n=1 Tax=Lysinibacillus telephonicus TaxID=1714840 RepID=UPI000F82EE86
MKNANALLSPLAISKTMERLLPSRKSSAASVTGWLSLDILSKKETNNFTVYASTSYSMSGLDTMLKIVHISMV